jgi:actin-related protein
MFPGYASRIEIELKKLYTENNLKLAKEKVIKIKMDIIDSPRRKYSVFIGATILSNLYNNATAERDYWISSQDWKESGRAIIKKKCKSMIK